MKTILRRNRLRGESPSSRRAGAPWAGFRLSALPRLYPNRPRGSEAMIDSAGAKARLASYRPRGPNGQRVGLFVGQFKVHALRVHSDTGTAWLRLTRQFTRSSRSGGVRPQPDFATKSVTSDQRAAYSPTSRQGKLVCWTVYLPKRINSASRRRNGEDETAVRWEARPAMVMA